MTETPSLDATEAVGAKGAKHPRITLDYIKSQIAAVWYIDGQTLANHAILTNWNDKLLPPHLGIITICMVRLRNGFILIGKSAPLSPDNYDLEKGQTFAYEDALRQTWPLFAFAQLTGSP